MSGGAADRAGPLAVDVDEPDAGRPRASAGSARSPRAWRPAPDPDRRDHVSPLAASRRRTASASAPGGITPACRRAGRDRTSTSSHPPASASAGRRPARARRRAGPAAASAPRPGAGPSAGRGATAASSNRSPAASRPIRRRRVATTARASPVIAAQGLPDHRGVVVDRLRAVARGAAAAHLGQGARAAPAAAGQALGALAQRHRLVQGQRRPARRSACWRRGRGRPAPSSLTRARWTAGGTARP